MKELKMVYNLEAWGYVVLLLLILGSATLIVLAELGILRKLKDSLRALVIFSLKNMQAKQKLHKQFQMQYKMHYKMHKNKNKRRFKQRVHRIWQRDGEISVPIKRVAQ